MNLIRAGGLAATLLVGIASNAALADEPPKSIWMPDTKSGCLIWDAVPQPKESVSWSGACADGYADGVGVEQWLTDGKPTERYEGELQSGKHNGRGDYTFVNGDRYVGEFRDGKPDGQGVFTYANGSRYEGALRNGERSGRGIYTYASGARYEGEFRDGHENGRGIYTFVNGNRYDGEFRDSKFNGHGILMFADGNRYDGEFLDGQANGHGSYLFVNGARYDGEFSNNLPNGVGTLTTKDTTVDGNWLNGCLKKENTWFAVGREPSSCRETAL